MCSGLILEGGWRSVVVPQGRAPAKCNQREQFILEASEREIFIRLEMGTGPSSRFVSIRVQGSPIMAKRGRIKSVAD